MCGDGSRARGHSRPGSRRSVCDSSPARAILAPLAPRATRSLRVLVLLACWSSAAAAAEAEGNCATTEAAAATGGTSGHGQLHGKVAIITGASRGVGAALARVFAREGACVVVNYFKSRAAAEAIEAELNLAAEAASGAEGCAGRAMAVYGDVTQKADMDALVAAAVREFGGVHVLVNNALAAYKFDPTSPKASIKSVTWEDVDQQLQGTLRGAVDAVQACLPTFEAQGFGKVLNIGTNLVYNPVVPYYDYTTAKAALVAFTRNLAAELGPVGVRVNLIAGGLLEKTDASSLTTPEVFEFVASNTPLRKTTTVQDFAEACVFFAADASNAVTGQSLSVDGGLTMP